MAEDNYMPNDIGRASQLLGSCCNEAIGADLTAGLLDNLRSFLAEPLHPHMIVLSDGLRACGRLLRDLVGNSNKNYARVPVTLDYLEVLLPSLRCTLAQIKTHYDDASLTMDLRWRTMYHKMTEEADGLPLPQRVGLYNQFLHLLGYMLTRSHYFDMNALEALRDRILKLREKQGIAPPSPPPPPQSNALVLASLQAGPLAATNRDIHWAEEIFSRPLPCRTSQKHLNLSMSYGPWSEFRMPSKAKTLFQRWFDQGRLSLIVFTYPGDEAPFIVIRSLHHLGTNSPLTSVRGIHELCISRDGSCLVLKRWSQSEGCSKLWAVLYFITWEEMVLFHCTFVALKSQCYRTRQIKPEEFKLSHEKREFQARIIDDGFTHSLIVYRDAESHGIRLHTAVWEGEMRRCPVWTAFVTDQARSSKWLQRKGRRHVWLQDVQLYVFCNIYREDHMRQNKSASFEIDFVSEEAAQCFEEVFYPPPPTVPPSPALKAVTVDQAENSRGGSSTRKLPPAKSVAGSSAGSDSHSASDSAAESFPESEQESERGSDRGSVQESGSESVPDSAHDSTEDSADLADLTDSLGSVALADSTDASEVTEMKPHTGS